MDYLTSNEVLEAIKQFSKTAKGKSEIKERMTRKREFIPKYWDKNAVFRTIKQMYRAAQDMADILYKHIITDTVTTGTDANGDTYQRVGLSKFNRDDIHVHHPVNIGNGEYRCNISISESALHRDSLVPNNDGIDDIISLFVHGYTNAKRSVHGEWHGMEIWTPRNREANPAFLQNAIDEFNQKYKEKAVATLKDEYNTSKKQGGEL
jgi:hypothetical protein